MAKLCIRLCCLGALLLCLSSTSAAYSVLTHEEIVDLLWNQQIRPLLLERFPGASEQQLKQAHAYAYGGAVIQDLGYYPFGNDFFSDLLHYVRSGALVENMVAEASNLNEFAFALGALAHYASDITGHWAVNRAVAIEYHSSTNHLSGAGREGTHRAACSLNRACGIWCYAVVASTSSKYES